MPMSPRLLAATLAFVPSLVLAPCLASAAPATPGPATAPPTAQTAPTTPTVQRPTASPVAPATGAPGIAPTGAQVAPGTTPTTTAPTTTPTTAPMTAPAGAASGPAVTGATPLVPAAPTDADLSGSDPAASPSPEATTPPTTDPSTAPPGLAEQLLGPSVNRHPSERAPGQIRSEEESAEQEDAAIAAMYRNLFRPPGNPGRFNVVVRGVYMIAGNGKSTLSGRLGGITADIGQSFNKIGYAVTVAAHFGSLLHTTKERETQTIALLGGGPTINLGRLALLQRGFLDARLGYDFFVAPTREIIDNMAIADGIRAPHGPRFNINMGLLSNPARARKLFSGFGLTIGYQALVGDLRGDLPFTNMLQFGLVYWGG